jgi:hypothetical protein
MRRPWPEYGCRTIKRTKLCIIQYDRITDGFINVKKERSKTDLHILGFSAGRVVD